MSDDVHGRAEPDPDARMDARLVRAGAIWRATATLEELAGATDDPPPVGTPEGVAAVRRRSRVMVIASAAVVVAALVVGGTVALRELRDPAPAGTGGPIAGTVWQLQGYGSQQGSESSDAIFYLGPDGRLVADDTCEVVTADARPSADIVRVTALEVRPRSCTDAVGETTFTRGLDVLRSDPSYSVVGDRLTIGDGSDAMHLQAVPGALPPTSDVPTFQQTDWRLQSGSDGNGRYPADRAFPLLKVARATLRTGAASTSVTDYLRYNGDRVTIFATKRGSGDPATQPLQRLVNRVYRIGTFTQRVVGSTLTVTRHGVGSLVYRWVPRDGAETSPDVLTGRGWDLRSVAGDPALSDSVSLRFSPDGVLSGNDGCRPISGHADVRAGSMTVSGVTQPTGPASCTEPAARDQASTIDSFLDGEVLWAVRDGRLWIDPAGGSQAYSLVLSRTPPTDISLGAGGFVGHWRVIAVRPAGREHDTGLNPGLSLRLAGGGYELTSGCGARSGAVSSPDPDRIVFGRATTTSDHSCPYVEDLDGPLGRLAVRLMTGTVRWSLDSSGDLVLARGGARVVLEAS